MGKTNTNANSPPLKGSVTVHITTSAELSVTAYPQVLLETCKGLIKDTQFGISIVVAHMACEVATERSLSAGFAKKELQYLETPMLEFMNGFNLGNDKNRKFYNALTGDAIEKQSFWSAFKESATRRNNIIHNGKRADKPEAESSHQAATAFVNHLSSLM